MNKNNIKFGVKPIRKDFPDLEGMKFGRLSVLGYNKVINRKSTWWCECDCGTILPVLSRSLIKTKSESCGCLQKELASKRFKRHGKRWTPEYNSWLLARGRCNTKTNDKYPNYGGRGIKFKFKSFEEFYKELGDRPSPKHSIDRIDNDGHYEKGNVRWATIQEQANNKTNNIFITYKGKKQTLAQWCRELDLKYNTILLRIKRRSWDPVVALTTK